MLSKGADSTKNVLLSPISVPVKFNRFRHERTYKRYNKLESKAVRYNTKHETAKFRFEKQAKNDVPTTKSSNLITKAMHKKRVQKQYRNRLKQRSKKVYKTLKKRASDTAKFVSSHLKKLAMILIIIFMILNFISSCGAVITQGFVSVFSGVSYASYTAEEKDIADADWYFFELETKMESDTYNAEEDFPDYNEYKYWLNGDESSKEALIDAIEHDPFELISYLTVMFDDFKFEDVKAHLDQLFDDLFKLEISEEKQIRTRVAYDDFGNPYDEEYEYKILHIKLTVNDFEETVKPYMDGTKEAAKEHYDTLIETEGNHQSYGSPFNFFWHNNISCHYGGRDNPTGVGREMHTGLDIAAPGGTPIYSVMKGTVTFAGWHNQYGNYVDITDKLGNKSRYAHCSKLLVTIGQNVEKGEVIAEVGTTGNSTGNHLHIEIFQGGNRINPLFVIARQPKTIDN